MYHYTVNWRDNIVFGICEIKNRKFIWQGPGVYFAAGVTSCVLQVMQNALSHP